MPRRILSKIGHLERLTFDRVMQQTLKENAHVSSKTFYDAAIKAGIDKNITRRLVGPFMVYARSQCQIKATGEYVVKPRNQGGKPVKQYISLLYGQNA